VELVTGAGDRGWKGRVGAFGTLAKKEASTKKINKE